MRHLHLCINKAPKHLNTIELCIELFFFFSFTFVEILMLVQFH